MSRREAGFSLTEVLIALAILSAAIVPLLSVVQQSSRNYEYALQRYQTNLLLSGLLLDVGASLEKDGVWMPDFSSYETDRYEYAVTVTGALMDTWRTDSRLTIEPAIWSGAGDGFLITAAVFTKELVKIQTLAYIVY